MTTCKKITLTAAAMVLSAGLAVGGTLAYLNAVTETKTNTFTSSRNITTTLTETEWTSDSGKNYLPGDVIKCQLILIKILWSIWQLRLII